jgi:hypothetical protein
LSEPGGTNYSGLERNDAETRPYRDVPVKNSTVVFMLVATLLAPAGLAKKNDSTVPTLRWEPGAVGCSLEPAPSDNLDRYTIAQDGVVVTLAVDPRELTQSQRRAGHVVSVFLSVRNTSRAPLAVQQSKASLEFVQHSRWRFSSWDPDNLANHIQNQTDDLMHQTDKDLEKRPEKVEKNEDRLREHQKLVSEMLDFLSTKGLKDAVLDSATPEVSGWIFFPSRGKWVGDWKKTEEFVFRIPVGTWLVEFPFQLPPARHPQLKERL